MVDAMRGTNRLRLAKMRLGREFMERLMLAVTEVNGCAACAWGHSKAALEAGIDSQEISELLSGDTSAVPADQAPAIAFAQHYADTTGSPTDNTWHRMIAEYGEPRARDILAVIRIIMLGNAYGIPLSSLIARCRGEVEPGSSVLYEIGMLLSSVVAFPVAIAVSRTAPDKLK